MGNLPAKFVIDLRAKAERGEIESQEKAKPKYWIEVTSGMSGYFAVMLWDGMGFAEPWMTGDGRYEAPEQAAIEARMWAEDEGVEYRA